MFKPTMTPDEIRIREKEAKVKIQEAKAISENIKARQAQIDYDKTCDRLCYIESALLEFNRKLTPAMALIKTLATDLTTELKLKPAQHEVVTRHIMDVLAEFAQIEFKFETAAEVDARTAAAHGNGLKVK